MSEARELLDVSRLPNVSFGPRNVNWWGTLGFMVVEGTTLVVVLSAYLYLRQNFAAWPPEPAPLPRVLVPTLNTLLLLGIIVPMRIADRAAHRRDLPAVRRALVVATALALVAVGLRVLEFQALNTRWDAHAYGSVAWAVLVAHTLLLGVDLIETGAFALLMFVGPVAEKHFADVADASFYQYFLSLSYLPVYAVLFLGPRVL